MKTFLVITIFLICAIMTSFGQVKDLVMASEKLWGQPKETIIQNLHHLAEERTQLVNNTLLDVVTYLSGDHKSTDLYFKDNVLVMIQRFFYGPNDKLDRWIEIATKEMGPSTNDSEVSPQWITANSIVTLREARGSYVLLEIKGKNL